MNILRNHTLLRECKSHSQDLISSQQEELSWGEGEGEYWGQAPPGGGGVVMGYQYTLKMQKRWYQIPKIIVIQNTQPKDFGKKHWIPWYKTP